MESLYHFDLTPTNAAHGWTMNGMDTAVSPRAQQTASSQRSLTLAAQMHMNVGEQTTTKLTYFLHHKFYKPSVKFRSSSKKHLCRVQFPIFQPENFIKSQSSSQFSSIPNSYSPHNLIIYPSYFFNFSTQNNPDLSPIRNSRMSGEGFEIPTKESGEGTGASTSSSTTTVVNPNPTRRNRRGSEGKQTGRFFRNQVQGRAGTPIVNNANIRPTGPIRPRSLFTARTGNYHQENQFQNPYSSRPASKFFSTDNLPSVDWDNIQSNAVSAGSATVVGGTTVYSPNGIFSTANNSGGEGPVEQGLPVPALLTPTKTREVYAAVQNMHEFGLFNSKQCFNFRGEPMDDISLGALITADGMLSVRLQHGIRVDITTDRAIRIQNNPGAIIMSLNATGSSAAMIHPSGRVYQYGSRVEITTSDHRGNAKYAKMWHKGVSFSAESCALVYLVDTAGTRTTTDSFSDLSGDFSVPIFLDSANFGSNTLNECMALLQASQYWQTEDGIENWILNGIRISQTLDGMVRVGRTQSKHNMRTSPFNGTASMSTPYVHCTASVGNACHLFVKRGERRMHYDGLSFIVRNAGHSAGFDDNHKLKVY